MPPYRQPNIFTKSHRKERSIMNHDFLTSLNTKTSDNLPSSLFQIGNNNIQTPYIGSLTINNNSTSKIFFNSMIDDDFDDFFVKTNIYIQLTKYLEEMSVVILIGQPGVEKQLHQKRLLTIMH